MIPTRLQPGGSHILRVESLGRAGGEFGVNQAVDGLRVQYSVETRGDVELLDDLQWADWDPEGRLLVATRTGALEVRSLGPAGFEVAPVADLSLLEPDPGPAPAWAETWKLPE